MDEPVTEMLSLSKPVSILLLLSLSLFVVVKGGDMVNVGCVPKLIVVVVGEPSGLVVLCAVPTVDN